MSLRQERDRGCRVPFSSLRDPVLAGSRLPEPEVGKPLGRHAARRRRLALPAPARRLPAFGPCVFFAGPALPTPGNERKLCRWFPDRRVEKPTVNASGSPPTLREGEREGEVNFTARENHPDSQPGGGLQM